MKYFQEGPKDRQFTKSTHTVQIGVGLKEESVAQKRLDFYGLDFLPDLNFQHLDVDPDA